MKKLKYIEKITKNFIKEKKHFFNMIEMLTKKGAKVH